MAENLKHRWSLAHNHLAGLTAGTAWRLLRENRVDPAYWHRAIFITLTSLLNSWYARREAQLYEEAIEKVDLADPPLFVLGHWRSGTTLLHNLLAQDTAQFAFPNTYQVVNPHTFLCTETVNTRRFRRLLPARRPMDNMELRFASPQEDEIALCLMTLLSSYLTISFPRRHEYYERYLTFRDVPAAELAAWKRSFTWFAKKLTFKYGRPLVLKSPPHTARIRLLLGLFPGARFVHIHRHPYTLFQSTQHYFDTAAWFTYLQKPERDKIDAQIFDRHIAMYDAFFAEQPLIPEGQFHEVTFVDLERDPLKTVAGIYERLRLQKFSRVEPHLGRYVESLRGYRKNEFTPLPPELRKQVAIAWQRSFQEWNYPV